jgi:hypothetical protein
MSSLIVSAFVLLAALFGCAVLIYPGRGIEGKSWCFRADQFDEDNEKR